MKTFILITVLAVICQASSLSRRKKRGTITWSSSNVICSADNESGCGKVYDFTNSEVQNVQISAYVYSNDEITGECRRANVPFTRSGRYNLDFPVTPDECRCKNTTCERLIEGKLRTNNTDCCGKVTTFLYGRTTFTHSEPATNSCVEVVGNSNGRICYCDPKNPDTSKCFDSTTTTPTTTTPTTPTTTITTTPTTTTPTTPTTTITTTPTTTTTTMPTTTTPTKLCPIPSSVSSRVFSGTAVQKCGTGVVRFKSSTNPTLCNGVYVFNPKLDYRPFVYVPTKCWAVIQELLDNGAKGLSIQLGNSTYPVKSVVTSDKPVPGSSQYHELALNNSGCLSPMCQYNPSTMDKAINKSSCYMESYGQDKNLDDGGVIASGALNKVNMHFYNSSCVDGFNVSGECFELDRSAYSCSGDWGSPVSCKLNTGENVLYGMVGYQKVCGPSSNIFPVVPLP